MQCQYESLHGVNFEDFHTTFMDEGKNKRLDEDSGVLVESLVKTVVEDR